MKGRGLPKPKFATLNEALLASAGSADGLTWVELDERERSLSFPEIVARAGRVASALSSRGVAPGDRVAIVLPTGEAFSDAFFGALLAGAVPVPLYPPVRLGRLEEYHASTARMIGLAGPRIVLTDDRVGKLLGEAVRRARPPLGCHRVETLRSEASDRLTRTVEPESLGLIQFSSGSTVDPKPVALTHGQLIAQLAALHALFPPPRVERHLGVSWLPLYHDMGLIGSLLSAIYYPGPLVLIPPEHFLARPALWLRAISRHRATISSAPNFAYAMCVKRVTDAELENVDLSSWQLALNGAEPVSVPAMRRFIERFSRCGFRRDAMMPVYGLSEAALAVTFTPPDGSARPLSVDPERLAHGEIAPGPREIASVGYPVPGCEIEIRDELGAVLPDLRVGRIHVRAPFVMLGYFEQPEATARALSEGWLDTGDLGFLREGELHVCGRAKDLVIIRGANHSPQEFEDALEGVDGLRAGCAVALGFVPEGGDGEALLVLVERANGVAESRDGELREAAIAAIVERTHVRPHTLELLAPGTLPRTSSGKLRRTEALRRYLSRTLTAPKRVTAIGVATEVVRSAIAYARAGLNR
jgi:fatty-acyl-CoA synthase